MIEIEEIQIAGMSEAGPFGGTLTFSPGLQVISAPNSFGKSLAANAVPWCFGAEPIFGIADNAPLCFPEAVRDRIDFETQKGVPVLFSSCRVSLKHQDGRKLRLSRAIKGDPTTVTVEEISANGAVQEFVLNARKQSMQDATAGLQNYLFRWFGWPRENVAAYRGESELYVENLVPLFYIDQDEGWTDIQALQISRYQQIRISEIAVEYLLGALNAIRLRVQEQLANQRDQSLRDRARTLAERIRAAMLQFGWSISWSGHGPTTDTIARWSGTTLEARLQADSNVNLVELKRNVSDRIDRLREALTKEPLRSAVGSAPAIASQRVAGLKQRRHDLNGELQTLRVQEETTAHLDQNLESKIASAHDLLRYKSSGIGRIGNEIECPTCHRFLELNTFALSQQSEESIATHIEALKRDRRLVQSNLESIKTAVVLSAQALSDADKELRLAQSALRLVTDAVGPVREQLAQLAIELATAEREADHLDEATRTVANLQREVGEWLAEATSVASIQASDSDIEKRKAVFTAVLFDSLVALGHSAMKDAKRPFFRVDDQYVPYLDGRRVRSLGSASDHARLVAAYTIALALTSEDVTVSGLHPGFVLLDEPLQQNPDDPHRELFLKFLKAGLPIGTKTQVIILTNLRSDEIQAARAGGTIVTLPEGNHFLKLIPTVPANLPPPGSALDQSKTH